MTSGSPSPASRCGESEGLAAFSHRWSDSDGWTITKHPKCPHGNISGAWDTAPNLGFFRSGSEYHSQKGVFPETTTCSKRDLDSYYLGPDIQLSIVSCCLKVSLVFPPTSSSFFGWSFPGSHKFFNHWPKVSKVGELYAVNCGARWLDFLEVLGLFHPPTEYQPKMLPDMMVSEVRDGESGSCPDAPEPPPYCFHYAVWNPGSSRLKDRERWLTGCRGKVNMRLQSGRDPQGPVVGNLS